MCSENNDKCCLYDILNGILMLQDNNCDTNCPAGCDKPFLGPTPECVCYNTRPVSFYNCQTGELWNINYTIDGTTSTSNVFRVENLDECCCTCRILIPSTTEGTTTYTPTNQFFTIDLNCVSALQCYNDVFLDLC